MSLAIHIVSTSDGWLLSSAPVIELVIITYQSVIIIIIIIID
jgi:hypothetical protein